MKAITLPVVILAALLFISGCAQKQTPEDITRGFWQAVVANDLEKARSLTTKASQSSISVLNNREKTLRQVEVGSARISETTAEVPTTLIGDRNGEETRIELTTFLLQEEESWRVEGDKTVNALVSSSLEGMLKNLTTDFSALGSALNQSITTGLREFLGELQKNVPELKKELGQYTDENKAREIGQELGALFSRGLRDAMKEFSTGMEELTRELEKSSKESE
jgi:hypothetical protein